MGRFTRIERATGWCWIGHCNRTSFQLATCAALAEALLAAERERARERQDQTKTLNRDEKGRLQPVPQKFAEQANPKSTNESAEKVAKEFGTNRNYLRRAIRLKEEDPEVFEQAHKGEVDGVS